MTTLTERYISAVARHLPAATQDDVREELAASIADDIEARIAAGEPLDRAERAVLTELGAPDALAAGYADRPLHLIGPRYYLTWWRLLTLLLWIVPLCAVGGVLIGKLIDNAGFWDIVGTVWVVAIGVIVHVTFWTTLVFAILDRTGADATLPWDPDTLPEPSQKGTGKGDLIASLVLLGIAAGLLLWDRFFGVLLFGEGAPTHFLPLLDPELWPWWAGIALLIIALEAVIAVVVYARRGWSRALAAANTVLAVVIAAGAVHLLVADRLINPAFSAYMIEQAGVRDEVGHILAVLAGDAIVGVAVWDSVDGWLKAVRARRG